MKKRIFGLLLIYALCIVLTSFLWSHPLVLGACFVLISVFMLYRWHTKGDVLFYFIAFVLGPLGEAILVHSGAWMYTKPSFLVPLWLPLLWGIVVLFLKKLCESLMSEH